MVHLQNQIICKTRRYKLKKKKNKKQKKQKLSKIKLETWLIIKKLDLIMS